MAHQRTLSTVGEMKEPHSVSLKVLRLSKPSLSIQNPLPLSTQPEAEIKPSVSLAYPSHDSNEIGTFILAPLLQLPPSFGSAYVGERFSCTLCANNELPVEQADPKRINGVRIEVEMKTPTTTISLLPPPAAENESGKEAQNDNLRKEPEADENNVEAKEDSGEPKAPGVLQPGQSLQHIVSYHLKEEGSHVLSVTVTYSETGKSSGRVRTFRKLYQFVAKPCLMIRTKTGALPDKVAEEKRKKRWALEAQLENVGEDGIVLETVLLEAKVCFNTTSINWDMSADDPEKASQYPILNPKEVQQVCFLVEENGGLEIETDGRLMIGQLNIGWRAKMGDRGFLSTGWLGTRLR